MTTTTIENYVFTCEQHYTKTYQERDSVFVYPTKNEIVRCIEVINEK